MSTPRSGGPGRPDLGWARLQHLEPVGWWHQAHSFVRGSWSRAAECNPMLMATRCHDVSYLVERPARRVSSFGSLSHVRPEHKPPGAAHRCLDCAVEPDCPYSARTIYLDRVADPSTHVCPLSVLTPVVTEQSVRQALADGP